MRDPHGDEARRMQASARDQARIYQAGRDMSLSESHHHQHHHDYDQSPFQAFFAGRGPGRILIVVGLALAMVAFTGWMAIVFQLGSGDVSGPEDALGDRLPSGIPVGAVYFIGFGVGGTLMAIGSSMAKAAVRRNSRVTHVVITMVVSVATVLGLSLVLDGAPISALMPRFSASGSEGTGPTELVTATAKSAHRYGLTMTVTRIENAGHKGRVNLRVVNKADESVDLPVTYFALTDAEGQRYEPDPFNSQWQPTIGPGATQSGTIRLKKSVPPASGPLRAEFTHVFRLGGGTIAVTGIPTR
ncbi:hypothetical protein ACFYWP_00055 [Actinacidiphila glaucinigra]|uniref:hypothetical protein n=1 Tax=Actinacidiphila glaucinigra TaxID=235986 RepID=UPI0036B6FC97